MRKVFYALMVIIGVGLMLMPLSVPVFKSNAPYSVINTNWNGTSSFGKLMYSMGEVRLVLGPYDSAGIAGENGVLVVIGPNLPFSGGEIASLREFLNNGGVLLLADDTGTGNELLEGLGLKLRISGKPLLSVTYSKNAAFPVTAEVEPPYVGPVTMSRPSVLLHANGSDVILYSSNVSLFNGRFGAFPVGAEVKYGKGRVIVFSDPDIFTNSLFPRNEQFLKSLLQNLPEKTFFIDEAHHRDFNPYSTGNIVIRRAVNREAVFYYVLFVASIALLVESGILWRLLDAILSLLFRFIKPEEMTVDEVLRRLEEKGLDGDRLKTMLREIETGSKLGGIHGR